MIKHLIETENGIKFALDKRQIVLLSQALEPYNIAIMMGISDEEVPAFVKQHKKDVNTIIKSKAEINSEKYNPPPSGPSDHVRQKNRVSGSDIVSLKDYKQQKEIIHE